MLGKTPMMQQYKEIKQRYPDTILFFRLGDFYEMFGADAELASRELEITLTGRDAGMEKRVPMCGVPYHAADSYLAKLIQKGYKVAICEQVEDPKKAKGIVKREVIRVITPGTVIDAQLLSESSSNYLAALSCENNVWGLALCDVSTGDFRVTEFAGRNAENIVKDELNSFCPAEILLPAGFNVSFPESLPQNITYLAKTVFNFHNANAIILRHFSVSSLESFGLSGLKPAVCSAGAILHYLQETQKVPPQQILKIKYYQPDEYLQIDPVTFRNLEITRTIRQNEKKGSLLDTMDKTLTAAGARLLKAWLERPLTQKSLIEDRLTAVEVLTKSWSTRQAIRNHLAKVYDLERLTTRVLYHRTTPRELISFKHSLRVIPSIKKLLAELNGSSYLNRLQTNLDGLEDLYHLIDRAIEEEAPYNLNNGGVIKAGYHPEIDSLRTISANGKEWIAQLESREKEKTGIKSLKIGFNKVFGYYLEVTKANLALVPEYYQRKQTLANGERYITDELLQLENQVLGAEEKLLTYETEVFHDILDKIGAEASRIQKTAEILAEIDVFQSMAELAVKNGYTRPVLLEKEHNTLFFKDLTHPVVEKLVKENCFVPNDLFMPAELKMCFITGPNMGGKSTYCRSAALAILMAQAGSFVPAQRAEISLRDRIFARVGASDDLGSGQSTFMVEMNEVANILHNASPYSFVILDEVGRGTSTYDGLSMAWAVTEYLVKHLQAKTLFATHYHELTQLEEKLSGLKNLSVSVKERGEEIIFLHKIVEGPADKSYGIQVGRLAGLPPAVIARAKEILRHLEKEQAPPATVPDRMPDNRSDYRSTKGLGPGAQECLKQLRAINLHAITPLEALNKLYEMQQLLKDEDISD